MSLHPVSSDRWQKTLDFHPDRPIVIEPSQAQLSSDAGLLPLRQFDRQAGLTDAIAAAIEPSDQRDSSRVEHTVADLVRQRLFGILAGYEDQNDHDRLRHDPVLQLVCDRLPDQSDAALLGSQPTLSRLENMVDIPSLWRLRDVLVDQWLDQLEAQNDGQPPVRITLDVDAFDDPAHGEQQLTLFHGYYKQNQYLPIAWTDAATGMILLVGLRHGTCAASLGADDDLEYIVGRIRAKWPLQEHQIDIHLRADSGFGSPVMYESCERLDVGYTLGIGMNPRLKAHSEGLLAVAVNGYERSKTSEDSTGTKQRLFTTLPYQAKSWDRPRQVVIKAECHRVGTNRRAVVTNRPGAVVLPQAVYDDYVQRGESENRNKELKCDLAGDRLSDHRFVANFFRLVLHSASLNLLIRLRLSLPAIGDQSGEGSDDHSDEKSGRSAAISVLRLAQPAQWQNSVVKVAAEVSVSARRVLVRLSASWPHLDLFESLLDSLLDRLSRRLAMT